MKYAAKKILTLIITLFIVSLLTFLAFQVIAGDPVTKMLGTEATQEAKDALRAELGLEGPVLSRYFDWLTAFLRGDMGISYSYRMNVSDMLADKLPITFLLSVMAFALTVVISIPLGIWAGSARSKVADVIISALDQMVMSVPPFFVGILATWLFGTVLNIFSTGSFVSYKESWSGCIRYLILPAFSIAIPRIAMTVRMLRSSILTEQQKDYVRTARSRGADRGDILSRHVLRNALMPVITFLAVSAAEIMTGSIIIERVFAISGVSQLLMTSISGRDFPVVQTIVVILAAWIVIVNFAADLLYQLVDPRLRVR